MTPSRASHLALLAALATATGCEFREVKEGADLAPRRALLQRPIGYAEVSARVLGPRCVGCHQPGKRSPDLSTHAAVRANLDAVRDHAIIRRTMPKAAPLPENESVLLESWIAQGAPEAGPAPEPGPAPTSPAGSRARVGWEQVRREVLERRCLSCHFARNPDAISAYEDIETVRATMSTILFASVMNDAMPPRPVGVDPEAPNPDALTPAEKDLLAHWVVDGMPETTEKPQ